MKKIYYLLSIFLFVSINGCVYEKLAKEETENPPYQPPAPVSENRLKVTATVENTPFGKQNMESSSVGLFLYKNLITPILNNEKVAFNNNGYFEYTVNTKDSSGFCFAYYPYQSASVSDATYTGMIAATQDQPVSTSASVADMPSSLTDQMLMISDQSGTIKFVDEGAAIQFKNIFSLLCFKITKDADLTAFEDQRIKKFEMYMAGSNDTLAPLDVLYKLSGTYVINLEKNPDAARYGGPDFSSASSAKITARITNSPAIASNATAPIVVWIVTPPFNFYLNKLVVRMETENEKGTISFQTFSTFSGLGEIKRNTLTTFDVKLAKNNIYTDDIVKESFAAKPANSYIISEPGVYEIAAKTLSGQSLPDGVSADWLWASKAGGGNTFAINELIDNISFDPTAKTIRFRIGTRFSLTKGNVVIALKDASNTILWTWHLWITDKPDEMDYGGKIFLDRNLGALSADTLSPPVDLYGFVYQWGRKDPFIGGDGQSVNETTDNALSVARTHTLVNPSDAWKANVKGWSQADRAIYGTVARAINHPMTFIYNSTSSSDRDPADWLLISGQSQWSDREKTDADPCPYGYKVPGKDDISILYSAYQNRLSPQPTIWFYNRNNSNKYWEYGIRNQIAIWPVTGMRHGRHDPSSGRWIGGQLNYSGTDHYLGHGYYWTSAPWDEAATTIIPGASYNLMTRDHVLYDITYGPNADAYPVRCIKTTTPAP